MPKYRINCSTSQSYTLVVEAPSREAAVSFYDACDAGEFHRCNDETDWNLDDIYEDVEGVHVDVRLDENGDKLSDISLGCPVITEGTCL